jgi:GT2 family glycosyltransferase
MHVEAFQRRKSSVKGRSDGLGGVCGLERPYNPRPEWICDMSSTRQAPLVAVVTPVYNGARFLAETLANVQAQTYPNLVHVILDNASTDKTPEIIAQAQGGRVPILCQRNSKTISAAQNWDAAVRMTPTNAEYFRILCADDLMAANAIEKTVAVAALDPQIGSVGCLIGMGGTPTHPARIEARGLPKDRQVFAGHWSVKGYLIKLHGGLSPTHTLIRRRILDEERPLYDESLLSFDVDACLRVMLKSKYGFVHEVVGWSRVHEASRTSTLSRHEITISEWLSWIDRYGPIVMRPAELAVCRRAALRHHFRRLLVWRFKERDKARYYRHSAHLKSKSVQPKIWDYSEALLEWLWLALRKRRNDVGAARKLWAPTWAELPALSTGTAAGKEARTAPRRLRDRN